MTMLAMMEFIDNLSLEDRLYWQISRGDTGDLIELGWQRSATSGEWSIKTDKNPDGFTYDRHGVAAHLAAIDVDVEKLTRQLGASIMTQALYADLMLEGAKKLFGENTLQQGLGNAKRYVESAGDTITPTRERKSHLSLVGSHPHKRN